MVLFYQTIIYSMTDSCCNVNIDGKKVQTKIRHKGKGKFEITDGENAGKIVDASEVDDCKCSL